jgi:inorganic triphosphatase YgiF
MTKQDKNTSPRETEIKLSLSSDARQRLEAHPALHSTRATAPEMLTQSTTYFDTPEFALARRGISMRVRRSNGLCVQTVKWRDDMGHAPFGRAEREWPIDGKAPDLALLAETPAGTVLQAEESAAELRPAFTTEVRRTRRYLLPNAETVVEAVLDEGTITTGSVEEIIQELELELKTGQPRQLYRLALELNEAVALPLLVEGKAERGFRLATGERRSALKAEAVSLPRDIGPIEGFRRILAAALGHLLANQPAALAGEVEGVHQMRIAVRRLRSAIAFFEHHLDAKAVQRFGAELKHLGQVLGAVRDWDVYCGDILPRVEQHAPTAKPQFLRGPAAAARDEAHHRLRQELATPAFTSLVLGLAAWAEGEAGPLLSEEREHGDEQLAELAPALMRRAVRRMHRRGRHLGRRSIEELHELRKALKRVRYGIEFLSSLGRPKPIRAFLEGCKDLQERLGGINDASLAVELTGRIAAVSARQTLIPAFAAVSDWSSAEQSRSLRHLPPAWSKLKNLPSPLR